jgi:peptide deformylase
VRVGQRIFCVESSHNGRYPGSPAVPLYVAINPVVKILDAETVVLWEGCLSVPEWRAPVDRAKKLELEALDRHGKPFKLTAQGFHARIVQHEFDHLEGKVYLDRLKNLKRLTHTSYSPE